jgi:hypothetical protein
MIAAVALRLGICNELPGGLLALLGAGRPDNDSSAYSATYSAACAWNCSDSVEPVSAVVDEVPPMMV